MPQRHRPELVESIAGEPLVAYRRAPRTFRAGRVCAAHGCTTHLSIYNSGKYCATHGPYRPWSVASLGRDVDVITRAGEDELDCREELAV